MKISKSFLITGLTLLPLPLISTVISCSSDVPTIKEEIPQQVDPLQDKANKEAERINNFKFTLKSLAISTKEFNNINEKNILQKTNFVPSDGFDYKIISFSKNVEKGTCMFKVGVGVDKFAAISDDVVIKFNVLSSAIYNPFPSIEKIISPENFYKLQQGANKQLASVTNIKPYGNVKITITYAIHGDNLTRKILAVTDKGTIIKEEKINLHSLQLKVEKNLDFEFMTYVEINPKEGEKIEIFLPNGTTDVSQVPAISGQDNITIISSSELPNFIFYRFTNPFSFYLEK